MNKQNKIDYLNQKCADFPDCEGCPVMNSEMAKDFCRTIPFEDMDDQQAALLIELLETHENEQTITLSDDEHSHTGIGTSCIICGEFIPIGSPVHNTRICNGCIKKLRVLMGIEQDDAAEDYTSLRRGDKIYYVDRELGEVEEGIVDSVHFKDGVVDDFSVDFVESKDFDQFYGYALGKDFFLNKSNAEKSLTRGGEPHDG